MSPLRVPPVCLLWWLVRLLRPLLRCLVMAYSLPRFNILCNISAPPVAGTPSVPPGPYRVVNAACALINGRRVSGASSGGTSFPGTPILCIDLVLPKLADVRGPQDTVSFDMVEAPAGSGRWYQVVAVDDIGKGWANEHRHATLFALAGSWAAPYA